MSKYEKIKEVTDQEWENVNEFNKQIVEEFLEQQHLSPRTLQQYNSALKIFFRWVKNNCENKPITELKPRDALRYQNYLMARDMSSSGVKFKRSAVSSLCGYIELYYSDEYPLFRNIYNKKIANPPKNFRHEKQPLTQDEFNLLKNTLLERELWQMYAYLMFSYSSGCRRNEARQLLKEVINYEQVKDKEGNSRGFYLTHNIQTKGRGRDGKIRKLAFEEDAMDAIKLWIEKREEDDCGFVFVTKTKEGKVNQVSNSTFNYWCTNIFSEIVGRRVHPHQLRSTRATHLDAEGKKIDSVQSLLGHQSPDTTKIYIIKDDDENLDDVFS